MTVKKLLRMLRLLSRENAKYCTHILQQRRQLLIHITSIHPYDIPSGFNTLSLATKLATSPPF